MHNKRADQQKCASKEIGIKVFSDKSWFFGAAGWPSHGPQVNEFTLKPIPLSAVASTPESWIFIL